MAAAAVDDEPMPTTQAEVGASVQEEEKKEAAAEEKGSANEATAPAAENVGQKQVEQDNQTQD